ncbi:MAG: hypothetical protein NVSMB51_09520 [Solirubrobacteraceae bacterium]
MAGVVHIPWYATGFRGDQLEAALEKIAATSTRYGASEWSLHRSRDDRYKFLQLSYFEQKADFDRYWYGPEFIDFRISAQSWFQVPVIYAWHDLIADGRAVVAAAEA